MLVVVGLGVYVWGNYPGTGGGGPVADLFLLGLALPLIGSCLGFWAIARRHMGYASIACGVAASAVPFAWSWFVLFCDGLYTGFRGDWHGAGLFLMALLGFLWAVLAAIAGIVAGIIWWRSRRGDPFIGGFGIVLCLASPLAWMAAWQYLSSLD